MKIKGLSGIENVRTDVTPERSVPLYPKVTPARISYPEKVTKEHLEYLEQISDDFRFWLYVDGTAINYYVLRQLIMSFILEEILRKFSEKEVQVQSFLITGMMLLE